MITPQNRGVFPPPCSSRPPQCEQHFAANSSAMLKIVQLKLVFNKVKKKRKKGKKT